MKTLTAFLCLTFAVLLFSAGEGFALPPCPEDENQIWHKCRGTYTSSDGYKYVGEFRDSNFNGRGTLTLPSGSKYVGEFRDSNFNGQGTYTWSNGDKYVGEWRDNRPNGQGAKTYPDGSKYVGEFRDGKRHGQGTATTAGGKKYVGEWRDGKPHGQGTKTFADGRVQEGVWENGKFQYARKEPKGLEISQGLLDELVVDEENTSSQIYELIKPILLYDPEVVKITVLKDLKVFKGDGFAKPSKNDDRHIYKWLNAKSEDILLKVNVQVNLDQNYVSEIKSKLAELADLSEPMDGSSCKRCKLWAKSLQNPHAVKFYIGAIKGNGRTQVYLKQKDATENMLETHGALGMRNSNVASGRDGLWVKKPFTFYGFDKSKENGKLCTNIINNVIADIQPPSVVDHINKKLKPAHDPFWSVVYPHILIKFVDGDGKIVNQDELFFDYRLRRTASIDGYGTAKVGENDTYQSIVSIDPNNGWHEQDYSTTAVGPKPHLQRFSELTNTVKFTIRSKGIINCRFGIAEQTNFSIITKVNKKILGSTKNIVVDMHYATYGNEHSSQVNR